MVDEPMPEQAALIPEKPAPEQAPPLPDAEFDAITKATQEGAITERKQAVLAKMQALVDAKIAEAHAWATKNGGFPAVKLALEELEEVFK